MEKPHLFQKQLVDLLKTLRKWPPEIAQICKEPSRLIESIDEQGSYKKPITYLLSAGIVAALIGFPFLVRLRFSLALGTLLWVPIVSLLGTLIGTVIANLLFGFFGKRPSFYKTLSFAAILSFVIPAHALLTFIHPIFAALLSLATFYFLFVYARIAAQFSEQRAYLLVAALLALSLTPIYLSQLLARRLSASFFQM